MRKHLVKQQRTFIESFTDKQKNKWVYGSPYWDFLSKHQEKGDRTGADEIQEPQQGNPDYLAESDSFYSQYWERSNESIEWEILDNKNAIAKLTKTQRKVIKLLYQFIKDGGRDGFLVVLSKELKITPQGVKKHLTAINKKFTKLLK